MFNKISFFNIASYIVLYSYYKNKVLVLNNKSLIKLENNNIVALTNY